MRKMLKKFKSRLLDFHRDQQGADMVEYVLIVAAIVLPVLVIVIVFRDKIKEWMYNLFGDVQSKAEDNIND